MDFSLPPETESLRRRIRDIVNDRLIPLERDPASYDEHENIALPLLAELRAEAKAAGIWALGMPRERGGGGLPMTGLAACYEEMNRSIFGPVVFNGAAPDDGNMRVLETVGTTAQKQRWLQPIVDGTFSSAFAMTEPDGCGSDPSLTYTKATREGDHWRIQGRKHYITGAGAAKHFILIARTSDDARRGLSAFLFHADDPGWHIVRRIPIMGPEEHGGHCELAFENLTIPDENRLMEIGDGLRVTQVRLGPARLTHCMRWTGLAKRCLAVALDYVQRRQSFGAKLADHESVQGLLGQAAMDIDTGRLLTMRAAWLLDQGQKARKEISMAKVVVADALHRAADTALQLLGARGYSKDTPVEWIYRYARQARLVDGASEVHRNVLAAALLKERDGFWSWGA
ncbi:MAG: acyl-CoA dehydrogenase family protein [Acetobacteraceae bacterium]|nr:acyl-CoA dehydrogenase family protein [Acetobacteraceae bacterium]